MQISQPDPAQAESGSTSDGIEVGNLRVKNRARDSDHFGLLCVVGSLSGNVGLEKAEVRVKVGGKTYTMAADDALQVVGDKIYSLEVNVVSHLLNDGTHLMELELLEDSRPIARFRSLSLNIRNHTALAKSVRADLEAYNTPVVIGRHIDSSMFPYESGLARAGFERDEPTDIELSVDPAADTKDALEHLRRWGFCVLPETLPTALIEGFKRDLDQAINTGVLKYNRGTSDRIHGAHQRLSSAREVWLYKPVLQFLETYFQDIPCACQTLTYVNGSEQGAHQDTIHLTPYPAGYMCGVWIALQDVQEGSGELFVYPGSHRERRLRASELGLRKVENDDYSHYATFDQAVRDLVDAGGYERLIYRPKAGQILVWHENLIHGGSQRAHPERERLSVVSHYFPRGSVGYYDSRGEAATLETLPS